MTQTILVVDDKKELLTMVKLYLTQEGFRVVTAMDGQEALYVARYEKPDLILLDLMMPQVGGYEFMRAYTREAETPIVILTAKLEEPCSVARAKSRSNRTSCAHPASCWIVWAAP